MKKALVLVLTQDPSLMQGPNNTTNSAGIVLTGKKLFCLFFIFAPFAWFIFLFRFLKCPLSSFLVSCLA
jgi:hypothetical protein